MPRKPTGGVKGKSRETEVIAVRLSKKDLAVLDRKVAKYPGEMSRGAYVRMRVLYDIHRKHISHKPKKPKPARW